jgi:hypothetical protein
MSRIDPVMTEYNLNYSQRSSPYGAVNTLSQLQQDRQCTYDVTLRSQLQQDRQCTHDVTLRRVS